MINIIGPDQSPSSSAILHVGAPISCLRHKLATGSSLPVSGKGSCRGSIALRGHRWEARGAPTGALWRPPVRLRRAALAGLLGALESKPPAQCGGHWTRGYTRDAGE